MKTIKQLRAKQNVNKRSFIFWVVIILLQTILAQTNLVGQNVAITDDSTYTPKASAILDVKSTDKGLLVPRVSLVSTSSASPVTAPDSSLMVYNKATAGDVTPGYYFWSGSKWIRMANGEGRLNTVTKTATGSVTKSETMVLASNDITLTLPAISAADDGLAITIKNIGTYTDLTTIVGNGAATIDDISDASLTRWQSQTYVASGGNWIVKEKVFRACNILDVAVRGSWTTIDEVIAFLNAHMSKPVVIRLCESNFIISSTQVINLPFPVTFEGVSYGTTTISAVASLSGNPMFNCQSDCSFKMLSFDGTVYGHLANEDAIQFNGSGTYNEVKDCDFTHFNKAITCTTNADLWLFETDIIDAVVSGLEIDNASGLASKITLSETDFTNCPIGLNLKQGTNEVLSVMNCGFYNTLAGDVCINYLPATFSPFVSMFITNNTYNNMGSFIQGFDFTMLRDANAFIQNNAGIENKNPYCKINVRNNASLTTVSTAGSWYKANWTNAASPAPCKFGVVDNKLTYFPSNRRSLMLVITGNLTVNNSNRTVSVGIVKNGVTGTRYGECDLRVTSASQPFQFSTVIYIENVGPTDYFELFCTSSSDGDRVTFQDVQWYTDTK